MLRRALRAWLVAYSAYALALAPIEVQAQQTTPLSALPDAGQVRQNDLLGPLSRTNGHAPSTSQTGYDSFRFNPAGLFGLFTTLPGNWTAAQTFQLPSKTPGLSGYAKFNDASGWGASATVPAGDLTGLAPSATIDTTNAANITSGTLPAARTPFMQSGTGASVQTMLDKLLQMAITPMEFGNVAGGVVGDGVHDDTLAVNAAYAEAVRSQRPLLLDDGTHKYRVTSGYTATGTIRVIGMSGRLSIYSTSCPSGLIVDGDFDPFVSNGPTGSFTGVCVQMATAYATRTTGTALTAGATLSINQGGFAFKDNTVIYAYDCIEIGGATNGQPTQTSADIVHDNVCIEPSHSAVAQGRYSSNSSTNGTDYANNVLVNFHHDNTATGFAYYDGAIKADFGENGPYGFNIGTDIIPGDGALSNEGEVIGQQVTADISGVFGDTSISHDLHIAPTTAAGLARFLKFNAWWGGAVTITDQPILIEDPIGAGRVDNITFNGGIGHLGNSGNTNPIIYAKDDVCSVIVSNNQLLADGGGTGNGVGVRLGNACAVKGSATVTGNSFGGVFGTLSKAIQVDSTANDFTITGNDRGSSVKGIDWTPAATVRATVKGNEGFETEFDSGVTVSCDGTGIACSVSAGSSSLTGILTLAATGSPGTGTDVFFSVAGTVPTNSWVCTTNLIGSNWDAGASVRDGSNGTDPALVILNGGVNFTASQNYKLSYACRRT